MAADFSTGLGNSYNFPTGDNAAVLAASGANPYTKTKKNGTNLRRWTDSIGNVITNIFDGVKLPEVKTNSTVEVGQSTFGMVALIGVFALILFTSKKR